MNVVKPLIVSLICLAPAAALAADWEEVYTQDEVTVSKMDLEGTKFYAFKGETVMDAPATRIMHVLLDNDHRIEWVDRLYEAVDTLL